MDKIGLLLTVSLAVIVTYGDVPSGSQESLLRLPVTPLSGEIHGLPLTSALTDVGSRLVGGYVVFGVEALLKDGKEPTIFLPHDPSGTLGSNLREVLRQLPDYEMRYVSPRLFEVFPRPDKKPRQDLLDIHVAHFSATNKPATSIIAHPESFIPELETIYALEHPVPPNGIQAFSGAFQIPALKITLHLQNVTVCRILESVVAETEKIPADWQPSGWALLVNADDSPGVSKHAWRVLSGVPGDWQKYRSE